jgi:hypothetical protein
MEPLNHTFATNTEAAVFIGNASAPHPCGVET